MRSGAVAFAVVFAVGLAALAAVGLTRSSDLVYSTGVLPGAPAAQLTSGNRACQGPYYLPSGESFDRVAFSLSTEGRRGAPIRVVVSDADSGRELATGRLPGGYPDFAQAPRHVVEVGSVESNDPLEICLVHERGARVAVLGQPGFASPHTRATVDGKPIDNALALTLRTSDRSLLALLPDMAERAARFRAGWITPAVYAILALLLLAGAPVLLARGIARAAAEDRDARA